MENDISAVFCEGLLAKLDLNSFVSASQIQYFRLLSALFDTLYFLTQPYRRKIKGSPTRGPGRSLDAPGSAGLGICIEVDWLVPARCVKLLRLPF